MVHFPFRIAFCGWKTQQRRFFYDAGPTRDAARGEESESFARRDSQLEEWRCHHPCQQLHISKATTITYGLPRRQYWTAFACWRLVRPSWFGWLRGVSVVRPFVGRSSVAKRLYKRVHGSRSGLVEQTGVNADGQTLLLTCPWSDVVVTGCVIQAVSRLCSMDQT
jgi:hypothetical protein